MRSCRGRATCSAPALPLAVAAITLASAGYCATLLLQHRLMVLTPDELSGHALGLHASGMLAMQGVGAALAGTVAQQASPATTMAVMAAASVAVTLALAPGLRATTRPALRGPPPRGPALRGPPPRGPALRATARPGLAIPPG